MKTFFAKDLSPQETLPLLTGGIGPRPIALVSTLSKEGISNLAPFSFFNAFGSNPPMVAFSPARRGRDGSFKDTYENLMETKECVVQVVTYTIVEQVNLASAEFPNTVSEFEKSGLTPIDSKIVRPKRVQESPFQMECKLHQMIPLGNRNGSGNLAICEVLLFHIDETAYQNGTLQDLVGRNGTIYYTRANQSALFEVPRALSPNIIAWDGLPEFIKTHPKLTNNQRARLSLYEKEPSVKEAEVFVEEKWSDRPHPQLEQMAFDALYQNDLRSAWHIFVYLQRHQ